MDTKLRGIPLPPPRFRIAPLPDELRHVRGFHSLQTFFPTLSKLYRLSKHQSEDVWLDSKWRITGLDISGTFGPCRLTLVPNRDASGTPVSAEIPLENRPAYLKVTHLLDPVRWMKGSYSLPKQSGLPWHTKTWSTAWSKLQDPWNQAYVESLASYALGRLREEGVSPHFNEFYGAFCARADLYRYNLTDDFESFRNARWFWNGQKKGLYKLCVMDLKNPNSPIDKDILDEILEEPSDFEETSKESDTMSEEEIPVEGGSSPLSNEELASIHSDAMSEVSFASEEDEEDEDEDDEDEEDEEEDEDEDAFDNYRIYSEIRDFPVMLIAVEENKGTMDGLLDNHAEVGAVPGTPEWELRWSAWLFQVLAALSVAQTILGFTHNDLHTNNIVWTETKEPYLYYQTRSGSVFQVPTFGKLFRLIDFGRSIFTINGRQFISDDFKAGNDADGQYCFKPLHPRPPVGQEVPPNPSFDLSRLAVSLFESLFPEPPEEKVNGATLSSEEGMEVKETVSPLYNVIWSWMIDDEGRNVLIEPNGEERYPDFSLYKQIAAAVHTAIPAQQFSKPAFDRFQVSPSEVAVGVRKWSLFA